MIIKPAAAKIVMMTQADTKPWSFGFQIEFIATVTMTVTLTARLLQGPSEPGSEGPGAAQ
jgi:hypothetical protein